jgi:hypothetical protein
VAARCCRSRGSQLRGTAQVQLDGDGVDVELFVVGQGTLVPTDCVDVSSLAARDTRRIEYGRVLVANPICCADPIQYYGIKGFILVRRRQVVEWMGRSW